MSDVNWSDHPADPRGGFQDNPDACINGTGWGGELDLNTGQDSMPYLPYETHTTGGGGGGPAPAA